jgi:3-methyladenine DNA glycosylase AlkD
MSLSYLKKSLKKVSSPRDAIFLQRFFKTGKGEYAEGDVFIGVRVPQTRMVVKEFRDLPLKDVETLLHSKIHEERLCALLILVAQFKQGGEALQKKIYDLYLRSTQYINNWDLVDSSADPIVGGYLFKRDKSILLTLAHSKLLWERRIAMIATFHFIKQGQSSDAFKIAEMLLGDSHDLMHKAVGWMLREVGKRCSRGDLEVFLKKYYQTMPRTALRYAIEHFPKSERLKYLQGTI